MIEQALLETRGNKSAAAKRLGLTRMQLYGRLCKYGLDRPDLDLSAAASAARLAGYTRRPHLTAVAEQIATIRAPAATPAGSTPQSTIAVGLRLVYAFRQCVACTGAGVRDHAAR